VRLAHQFAMESDLITADMVEATEFPHLAQRYSVRAVPRTIINETAVIEGAIPPQAFADAVRVAAEKEKS
jgi:predicted DsbA family dithiol-disulfide isomerase